MEQKTTTHSEPWTELVQALMILMMLCWLAAAPVIVMGALSALTGYSPKAVAMLGGVEAPGLLPKWATGALATLVTLLAEMVIFVPVWLLTRKRARWNWAGGVSAALVVWSLYQALWAVGGIPFSDKPSGTAALRLALTCPFLLIVMLTSRSLTAWRKPSLSTMLVALGVAACVLIPWLVLGALGTPYFTAMALVRALVNGLGEEIIFRGLLMLWLTRTTKYPLLAAAVSLLAYVAAQPGYVLPLGDWFVLGRLVMALGLGLLTTELFARGSLWPAILVHVAFEFGPWAFVDWRTRASLPHPAVFESLAIALAFGLALWWGRLLWNAIVARSTSRFPPLTFHLLPPTVFALLCLLVAASAYVTWGHPGFYRDGFLIILKEQADVSHAYTITDRQARVEYVYRTLVETAERTQAPIRAELDRRGVRYRPYYIINMIRVDDCTDLLGLFARRDDVAQVIVNPNNRVTRYSESMSMYGLSSPASGIAWNIRAVGADRVWKLNVTGQGIVVAGADTGVDWTHPAIRSQYRGWNGSSANHNYNWYDAWNDTPAPWDDYGHGTHTIGTVVGDDGQGSRIGMAPDAQWIACRNMRLGLGNPGAYAACMEFFLAPFPLGGDPFRDGRPDLAPHVINNSWGCPDYEGCAPDTLERAVENLRAAGIMMVVSAGNDGPGCSTVKDPAAIYDASFTVGAENASGQIASFSSRGPARGGLKPDVTAPGENVYSAVPGGGYLPSPGTSMAGPHVAGLVALMWSANPKLIGDIDLTEDIIRRTAHPRYVEAACDPLAQTGSVCGCGDDTPTSLPNNVYGYGFIDALQAVQQAMRR